MRVLLTGATGFVGRQLGQALSKMGHDLIVITRSKNQAQDALPFPCKIIEWNLVRGPLAEQIEVEAVINLMGEPVAKRWSSTVKANIVASRVQGTKNLILSLKGSVDYFISASAIGYYGHRPGLSIDEHVTGDQSFLSQVCSQWERSADLILKANPNVRLAKVRIGLVLSKDGGVLDKMKAPFRYGLGACLGNGQFFMSWIHIDDLVRCFLFILEKKLTGVFNAVSPYPATNQEFSRLLARRYNRSVVLSIPSTAINFIFGEMGDLLLSDQKVIPVNLLQSGFSFVLPHLEEALKQIIQDQDSPSS